MLWRVYIGGTVCSFLLEYVSQSKFSNSFLIHDQQLCFHAPLLSWRRAVRLREKFEIKPQGSLFECIFIKSFPQHPGLYSPHFLCSRALDVVVPSVDALGASWPTKPPESSLKAGFYLSPFSCLLHTKKKNLPSLPTFLFTPMFVSNALLFCFWNYSQENSHILKAIFFEILKMFIV